MNQNIPKESIQSKSGRDLKSHRIKPWAWFLWLGFDVCLVAYTVKSTYDVWPNLLWLALLGGVAVLVGSLYVSAHSYDLLDSVRKRATIGAALMTLALIINVLGHGAVSRRYSTVQEKRQEEAEQQKRTAEIASQERKDIAAILNAQTSLANANAQVERNAAIRSEADRRLFKTSGIRRNSASASAAGPSAIGNLRTTPVTIVSASPAAEADSWFWWVFGGFALEIIAAALVSMWVKLETLRDLNNNGIPDEQERQPTIQTPTNHPVMATESKRPDYATVDENNVAATLPHNSQVGTKATGPNGDVWMKTPNGWEQAEPAAHRPPADVKADKPFAIQGHQWLRSDDGWNLWDGRGQYVATLTHDEWNGMKNDPATMKQWLNGVRNQAVRSH